MPKWEKKLPIGEMDPEVVDLCIALNKLDGVCTTCSCCGHGKTEYAIFFKVSRLRCLNPVGYFIDGRRGEWRIEVGTHSIFDLDGIEPVYFVLVGPIGEDSYIQSKEIAKEIEETITNIPRLKAEDLRALAEDMLKEANDKLEVINKQK